eukprot:33566-Eustigmatos_ZCMA.PRE.1
MSQERPVNLWRLTALAGLPVPATGYSRRPRPPCYSVLAARSRCPTDDHIDTNGAQLMTQCCPLK